jgi:hypothetical protein
MKNTTKTKDAPALNWGKHPAGIVEGNRPLTPEDWGEAFGEWFIDYYVNHIAVPAAQARADGKPDAELEAQRDLWCVPYGYPDQPRRIDWAALGMNGLWMLFLDDLAPGWLVAWADSGRTLADMAVAFPPEDKALARLECEACHQVTVLSPEHSAEMEALFNFAEGTPSAVRVIEGSWVCPVCRKSE